jgi:hypothetical protein
MVTLWNMRVSVRMVVVCQRGRIEKGGERRGKEKERRGEQRKAKFRNAKMKFENLKMKYVINDSPQTTLR